MAGWFSASNARGIDDILWSCISTLLLCVWTAVHPNIQLDSSEKRRFTSRLGLMIFAVVFPEILIAAAWRQRSLAEKLSARIVKLTIGNPEPRDVSSSPMISGNVRSEAGSTTGTGEMMPRPGAATDGATPLMVEEKDTHQVSNWSSSQGFFVVMGGLSVRLRHENSDGVLQDHEYSFTPAGVELLAMADGLPAVTKEDVEERSNADVIAKIIVLCQVTWFALQVLSRLIKRLPVTALETHTTVHVGCAIMMYLFWFNKPYNVSRAILLIDAISREIGALLVFRKLWAESYDERLRQHEKKSERYWQERVINESQNIMVLDPPPALPVREPLDQAIERYLATISVESVDSNPQEKVLQTLSKDAKSGWQRLTTRYDSSIVRLVLDKTCLSGIKQTADNFEIRTVWGSWSKDVGHGWSKEKLMNMTFNVVYGAAHLTAWNASSFPTSAERWIWRISGLILAAVPVWAGLWIVWWKASTSNNKWLFIFRNGDMDIIGGPFFCVVIVAYTLARCYFLVEALVSLRHLPAGAYRQVDWSKLFPHTT